MGARVIAAASNQEKLDIAKRLGADEVINYSDGELKEKVKTMTDGLGADVIYDAVGGDIFLQCMRCINWDGRVLVIGFPAGIPKVPTNLALLKGCSIVGVFWEVLPAESLKKTRKILKSYSPCMQKVRSNLKLQKVIL